MGNNDLFLVSPSRRTDVKRVYGRCDEMHFYAHKIFSNLKGKKEGYSVVWYPMERNYRDEDVGKCMGIK
jgi:hypothetical protein